MSDENKFWLLIDLKLQLHFHHKVQSSFKSCACTLNIAINGSEDELIHCFKENQPCSADLQRLKVMVNTIDDEREDPFVSLSDTDAEQEAINELDSDDEKDEIIDI